MCFCWSFGLAYSFFEVPFFQPFPLLAPLPEVIGTVETFYSKEIVEVPKVYIYALILQRDGQTHEKLMKRTRWCPKGASPHGEFHSKWKLLIFSLLSDTSPKCLSFLLQDILYWQWIVEMVTFPTDGLVFLKRWLLACRLDASKIILKQDQSFIALFTISNWVCCLE